MRDRSRENWLSMEVFLVTALTNKQRRLRINAASILFNEKIVGKAAEVYSQV